MVRIPKVTGKTDSFSAHGNVFFVKKLGNGCYCLWKMSESRMRFGTLEQIRSDAKYCEDYGRLPPAGKSIA